MGVSGQRYASAPLSPGKRPGAQTGWTQGWSGRVRKISPTPGFDPRTFQHRDESLYQLSYRSPWLILICEPRLIFVTLCDKMEAGCAACFFLQRLRKRSLNRKVFDHISIKLSR